MTPTAPPFATLPAPASWGTIDFIADLHLQASEGATVVAWQDYLQHTRADAVFILGDLFEVWVGDDALDEPRSFEAQCCALLRQTTECLPVYFMHGNRDFLVGDTFFQRCGVQPVADPTVLDFAGQRWLLSHGDALCLDDVAYQRFRVLARSAAWQQGFLAQPLPTRRAQARDIRSQSEARKHTAAVYADVDDPTACAWLQRADCSVLIHGHTHRPADHVLAPHLARSVLSDWDAAATPARAEVLRLTASGLQRLSPVDAAQ